MVGRVEILVIGHPGMYQHTDEEVMIIRRVCRLPIDTTIETAEDVKTGAYQIPLSPEERIPPANSAWVHHGTPKRSELGFVGGVQRTRTNLTGRRLNYRGRQ